MGEHGSSSPRLDAELLCADALHLRRLDLYLQFDRLLQPNEVSAIRERVRRRGKGEPVAYITGEREFYGRSFYVTPDVLIPRPDTETLVDAALRYARRHEADAVRIADLGTGSGCVAITLAAELADASVYGVDSSSEALEVANMNLQRHELEERVQLLQGHWAEPLPQPVDIVVSNPPYVTAAELATAQVDVRGYEPAAAVLAGDDGMSAYAALAATLPERIVAGAALLVEVDPRRADDVASLLRTQVHLHDVQQICDLTGRVRVVAGRVEG